MARTGSHGSSLGALNVLSGLVAAIRQSFDRKVVTGTSAGDSAQTVTIPAQGAGTRIHLTSVLASYSNDANNTLTINLTQDSVAQSVQVHTGVTLALTGLEFIGDEDTPISVDAEAGTGGATSELALEYWVEDV